MHSFKGNPITPEHAQKIRQAVINLTGIPYSGPLAIIQERRIDQLPTLTLSCKRQCGYTWLRWIR
jgi:hypothetical protein